MERTLKIVELVKNLPGMPNLPCKDMYSLHSLLIMYLMQILRIGTVLSMYSGSIIPSKSGDWLCSGLLMQGGPIICAWAPTGGNCGLEDCWMSAWPVGTSRVELRCLS